MVGPIYTFDDFKEGCSNGVTQVIVHGKAIKTARSDFNLNTQGDVLKFIANDGLEKLQHKNSKLWGNNPEPATKIFVDAYDFCSHRLFGYLAFLFQPKTGKWIIKSFKKNTDIDMRHFPFVEALGNFTFH